MESKPISAIQALGSRTRLAIVLEGVPERWQINVLQVLAIPASAEVTLEGFGTIEAIAFQLSQDQARHLATQITELLGSEDGHQLALK